MAVQRCPWALKNPLMSAYHDREWGVPVHDDRKLFELLILEGMQAGLSWDTVLKKRENYRRALHSFDPVKISKYGTKDVKRLLADAGIIRNRLKVQAIIKNAKGYLEIRREYGSFNSYLWSFCAGKPITNRFKNFSQVPCLNKQSDAMSADLKKRGFTFVGSKICYSLMQASGMVNDHLAGCFRYGQVSK